MNEKITDKLVESGARVEPLSPKQLKNLHEEQQDKAHSKDGFGKFVQTERDVGSEKITKH
jgi:hypothetical protein